MRLALLFLASPLLAGGCVRTAPMTLEVRDLAGSPVTNALVNVGEQVMLTKWLHPDSNATTDEHGVAYLERAERSRSLTMCLETGERLYVAHFRHPRDFGPVDWMKVQVFAGDGPALEIRASDPGIKKQ